MKAHHLSYTDTGRFTTLVTDYLAADPFLEEFRVHPPSLAGLRAAASQREFSTAHRKVLVDAIGRQYEGFEISGAVAENIERLKQPNALTVTTGHQLNLFTGPLYVPFKLLNTIRLARTLSAELDRPVVPVFWMATEDHDRAEIDHTWVSDTKVAWPGTIGGAVGRMKLAGIEDALKSLEGLLVGAYGAEMIALVRDAYRPERTLAEATRHFVHALYGRYGLLIVDGDDKALKILFVPVMKEEVLNAITQRSVSYADVKLEARFPSQAHARPINLFHLRPGHRSRIEPDGDHFQVLDGGPRFTLDELLMDLEVRPQDYSPNVLMRPLFQELVLPNIAYIGGGGELAYWMQLRWLFQAVQVPMPVVLLRTSAAFLDAKNEKLGKGLGLDLADLFTAEHALRNKVAQRGAGVDPTLAEERLALEHVFAGIKSRAAAIDPTLAASTEATAERAQRSLVNLQGKMERAIRRREAVTIARLQRILDQLFPHGGLQERRDNVLPLLAERGTALLDELLEKLDPLDPRFTVLVD